MESLKLEYEYIQFTQQPTKRKTQVWFCRSKHGAELGMIAWYAPWRQYCFYPAAGTVFSRGCMVDIEDFISQLSNSKSKIETLKGKKKGK